MDKFCDNDICAEQKFHRHNETSGCWANSKVMKFFLMKIRIYLKGTLRMKQMINFNDYKTEMIFSYLRWIFLLGAVFLFYYPPIAGILQYNTETFPLLLFIGFVYMTLTQISLNKMQKLQKVAKWITGTGVIFDFIAFVWLLLLSGGGNSLFFPISYLLVMHATIYWHAIGGLVAFFSVTLAYVTIYAFSGIHDSYTSVLLLLNIAFLALVGFFGGLIVYRERSHYREKLDYKGQVVTDYLTGLNNHRSFQEELTKLVQTNSSFYLVMADIDFFKKINDQFGHTTGDIVLNSIGNMLYRRVNLNGGYAFRYGGEEFAFLFPGGDAGMVKEVIKNINAELNKSSFCEGAFHVTMSFGAASFEKGNVSKDKIVKQADCLLYEAKRLGRSRAVFEDGSSVINSKRTTFA